MTVSVGPKYSCYWLLQFSRPNSVGNSSVTLLHDSSRRGDVLRGANVQPHATPETYAYAPAAGQRPVVILSHGSSGGSPRHTDDWASEAAYFSSKGLVVLAPMRRARLSNKDVAERQNW